MAGFRIKFSESPVKLRRFYSAVPTTPTIAQAWKFLDLSANFILCEPQLIELLQIQPKFSTVIMMSCGALIRESESFNALSEFVKR